MVITAKLCSLAFIRRENATTINTDFFLYILSPHSLISVIRYILPLFSCNVNTQKKGIAKISWLSLAHGVTPPKFGLKRPFLCLAYNTLKSHQNFKRTVKRPPVPPELTLSRPLKFSSFKTTSSSVPKLG